MFIGKFHDFHKIHFSNCTYELLRILQNMWKVFGIKAKSDNTRPRPLIFNARIFSKNYEQTIFITERIIRILKLGES